MSYLENAMTYDRHVGRHTVVFVICITIRCDVILAWKVPDSRVQRKTMLKHCDRMDALIATGRVLDRWIIAGRMVYFELSFCFCREIPTDHLCVGRDDKII